jgi:hypothetical protein
LDFNEVLNKFGRKGPLLEFVFLLTKTKSLENRLKGQVQRIRREVREKKLSSDELKLLSFVDVATAFEVRLKTSDLVNSFLILLIVKI